MIVLESVVILINKYKFVICNIFELLHWQYVILILKRRLEFIWLAVPPALLAVTASFDVAAHRGVKRAATSPTKIRRRKRGQPHGPATKHTACAAAGRAAATHPACNHRSRGNEWGKV
jgi:hypothetical protein